MTLSGLTQVSFGALWFVPTSFISQGCNVLGTAAVATILGPQEFGLFSIIRVTQISFAALSTMGLSATTTRILAEFRNSDPVRCGRVVGLAYAGSVCAASLLSLLTIAAGNWLSTDASSPRSQRIATYAVGLLIVVAAVDAVQTGVFAGLRRFDLFGRLNVVMAVLSAALCIAGAYFTGVNGVVMCMVVAAVVRALWFHSFVHSELKHHGIRISVEHMLAEVRGVAKFSLPLLLTSICIPIATWGSNLILAGRPDGLAAVGVYNLGAQLMVLALAPPNMLITVAVPTLIETSAARRYKEFSQLKWGLAAGVSVLVCLLSAVILAGGGRMVKLFGLRYAGVITIMPVILATAVLSAFSSALRGSLMADTSQWKPAVASVVYGLVLVCLTSAFVAQGAEGRAYATFWADAALLICMLFLSADQSRTHLKHTAVTLAVPKDVRCL